MNDNIQPSFKQNDFSTPKLYNVLSREGLTNILKKHSNRKLLLILGKAGQGKSTLVADFIRKAEIKSSWIRLKKEESDPLALLEKLNRAVCTLLPEEQQTDNFNKSE